MQQANYVHLMLVLRVLKLYTIIIIQFLAFFTLVCTCVVLGELDFTSLEDIPGGTSNTGFKAFSDRLERTR